MSHLSVKAPGKIASLALYAQVAAGAGLALFAGIFAWLFYVVIFDAPLADWFLLDQIGHDKNGLRLSAMQRTGITGLFVLHELFGIGALIAACNLFSGYRKGAIFTAVSAKRLALVGWAVVALAPVSTLAETLAEAWLARIISPAATKIDISLSENDVYAIVFGLLIVVVGHIMHEAVKLSDENQSFV